MLDYQIYFNLLKPNGLPYHYQLGRSISVLKTYATKSSCPPFLCQENRESFLGPVFRPFTNSDHYSFQKLLYQTDVPTFF